MTPSRIRAAISEQLAWPRLQGRPVQVAFYGGSFSCLERGVQLGYLQAVEPFLASGQVEMVRVSTRPDCLDRDAVVLLQDYGVGLVEVGVQSLHSEVLAQSERGHSVTQVEEAFALLHEVGMTVGGQLMVGLPGDSPSRALGSGRKLCALRPDLVRIYPTLVVTGSRLAAWYQMGSYQPWSLAKSVLVCVALKEFFDQAGVTVIRMGLQAARALEDNLVAGPYHPAFGEMVLSRQLFKKLRYILRQRCNPSLPCQLNLASRDRSLFTGIRNENLRRLQSLGLLENVDVFFNDHYPRFKMTLQEKQFLP